MTARRIKVAPGRAIPPLVVQTTKAAASVARTVSMTPDAAALIRDAFEERGAERVSEAKRAETQEEQDIHLDLAAELFTLARLA